MILIAKGNECCPAPEFDDDFNALIEGIAALVAAAEADDGIGQDQFYNTVLNSNGYDPYTDGDLNRDRRHWIERKIVDIGGDRRKGLFLRPRQRSSDAPEPRLLARVTFKFNGPERTFNIGLEIFTEGTGDSQWHVWPIHFDSKNNDLAWNFCHLQSANRGTHLSDAVLQVAQAIGHRRLPRIPIAADSPTDMLRCATLSLLGNGEMFQRISQVMHDARGRVICHHLHGISKT